MKVVKWEETHTQTHRGARTEKHAHTCRVGDEGEREGRERERGGETRPYLEVGGSPGLSSGWPGLLVNDGDGFAEFVASVIARTSLSAAKKCILWLSPPSPCAGKITNYLTDTPPQSLGCCQHYQCVLGPELVHD
jgi:hypothetical protein